MTDESGQSFPVTIDTLLDNALGPEGYYGAFTANMHTDSRRLARARTPSSPPPRPAACRSSPARQMLTWLDGRNGSSFGDLTWSGDTLSFTVTAATGAGGLQAMLPLATPAGTLTGLTFAGSPLASTTETIKGITYAVFPAATGAYQATWAP